MSPHNRYRAAPPPPPVAGGGGQSALGVLGPLALKYGVNAAIPGGGFAADAAMGLGSTLFNEGGEVKKKGWLEKAAEYAWKNNNLEDKKGRWAKTAEYKAAGGAPLGGGQSKEGLMEARKLGALTQSEFLKAMAHAGYLQKGGKVKCGPLASVEYKSQGGDVSHHHKMSYHNPLAGGSSSKEK